MVCGSAGVACSGPSEAVGARLACRAAFGGVVEPRQPGEVGAGRLYAVGWKGSGSFAIPPSRGQHVDYTTLEGHRVYGWKAPVTIAARAAPQRLRLVGPADVGLVVADADAWASGYTVAHLADRARGPYTLEACGDPATFPALLYVRRPACAVLEVEDTGSGRTDRVRVPLYGGRCR